jgi:hypothetical protein
MTIISYEEANAEKSNVVVHIVVSLTCAKGEIFFIPVLLLYYDQKYRPPLTSPSHATQCSALKNIRETFLKPALGGK